MATCPAVPHTPASPICQLSAHFSTIAYNMVIRWALVLVGRQMHLPGAWAIQKWSVCGLGS